MPASRPITLRVVARVDAEVPRRCGRDCFALTLRTPSFSDWSAHCEAFRRKDDEPTLLAIVDQKSKDWYAVRCHACLAAEEKEKSE